MASVMDNSERANRAREIAGVLECIATFAAERNEQTVGAGVLLALADAAEKWPEDALRLRNVDAPDAEGEGDAVEALCQEVLATPWFDCGVTKGMRLPGLVAAARAQHARDRAELESLQERVGQAEGYRDLYRGACEARDVLAAELEALRASPRSGDKTLPRSWMCSICLKPNTGLHGEMRHFVCDPCCRQAKEREGEGERVIRLESDTPLRAITPGGGIISTVMFEKGLYAIRPVEEKAKVHTMRCGICGKQFDMRDLDQVFYHEQNPHRPLTDEERALALCDSRRVEEPKVRPWRVIRSVGSRLHKNEAWSICPGPEGEECGCIVSYDDARPDTCPNCLSPLDWSELPEGDDE